MATKSIVKSIKSAESTISVILGILVVVVIGVLLYNYFKNFATKSNTPTEEEMENEQTENESSTSLPTTYKVVSGDTLWSISEKFYKSGYNWVDVSKANNLKDAGVILVGQELVIPDVPVRQPLTATSSNQTKSNVITENRYTVVKGDSLWNISVRAYQDGFKWTEIAKANNLTNPDLIFAGTVLILPR